MSYKVVIRTYTVDNVIMNSASIDIVVDIFCSYNFEVLLHCNHFACKTTLLMHCLCYFALCCFVFYLLADYAS